MTVTTTSRETKNSYMLHIIFAPYSLHVHEQKSRPLVNAWFYMWMKQTCDRLTLQPQLGEHRLHKFRDPTCEATNYYSRNYWCHNCIWFLQMKRRPWSLGSVGNILTTGSPQSQSKTGGTGNMGNSPAMKRDCEEECSTLCNNGTYRIGKRGCTTNFLG
jgi:hypothetical protein